MEAKIDSKEKQQKDKKVIKKKKEHKDKKAEIHNQIIKHQSVFKKGKLFAIRKVVQKIKNFEKIPKQNTDAKKDRFEGVLNVLKHITVKRLTALALLQHRSTKNILADAESTPEQLAVAYFVNIDVVRKSLDTIYETLKLDEATYWRRQVKKLFKKIDNDGETKSPKISKEKDTKMTVEEDDEELVEQADLSKKSTKSAKPKRAQATSKSDNATESKEAESVVDDFFITAEGTSYMSTAVVKNVPNNEEDGGDTPRVNHQNKYNQSITTLNQQENSRSDRKSQLKRKHEEEKEKEEIVAKPEEKAEVDPNIHPSWQAKQRQKLYITGFRGHKIKFNFD